MADRRAQIEARLSSAAVEGPCRAIEGSSTAPSIMVDADPLTVMVNSMTEEEADEWWPIADLIAQAPADLRWLLDALAAADAERDEERRYLDVMRRKWGQRSNELGDLRQRLAAAEAERDALAAKVADVEGLVALETDAPGLVDGLQSSLRDALGGGS